MIKIYETEDYTYFTDNETKQLKDFIIQPDEHLNVSLKNYDIYKIRNIQTQKISYVLVDENDELISICNNVTQMITTINEIKWKTAEQKHEK